VKDLHVVGKIKARNGHKMAIYESYIIEKKSYKIEKNWNKKNVFYVIAFDLIKI
jgi:hypothetical protein